MAASIINNNNGTHTIMFQYTAPTQKIQDLGEDAAHQAYLQNPLDDRTILWDDMTIQDKLNLLDNEIKSHIVALAQLHFINQEVDAAKVVAETEAESRYI